MRSTDNTTGMFVINMGHNTLIDTLQTLFSLINNFRENTDVVNIEWFLMDVKSVINDFFAFSWWFGFSDSVEKNASPSITRECFVTLFLMFPMLSEALLDAKRFTVFGKYA